MKNRYNLLSEYIKQLHWTGGLVLSRGKDELDFLNEWINGRKENPAALEDSGGGSSIADIIQNCKRCQGTESRKLGIGSGKSGIMVLLNNPGLVSSKEKEMLRSEAVELLKNMIKAINIEFESCYITNLIKCEAGGFLNRPSEMFSECENILKMELLALKPEIVLVMGEMMPLRNIISSNEQISWYNLEHPLVLLKNPDLKRPAWNTLQVVMSKIKELGLK